MLSQNITLFFINRLANIRVFVKIIDNKSNKSFTAVECFSICSAVLFSAVQCCSDKSRLCCQRRINYVLVRQKSFVKQMIHCCEHDYSSLLLITITTQYYSSIKCYSNRLQNKQNCIFSHIRRQTLTIN